MNLINTIQNFGWIDLNLLNFIWVQFLVFLFIYKFNLNYRLRRWLKLSARRPIKIIDCSPCLSFWITLATTGNLSMAMGVYLITKIIDK